ncbi:UNVERIFIED_CONTAM: hypothetical protein PYX00_008094 [Menopon gallinae]|uniref:Matrix-remodeling-associated protein 7 helical domain-containing protein n=1 Tax=Menopon gallinae TaxID=328185 RepID=A0AAW2HMI2_9NEOP
MFEFEWPENLSIFFDNLCVYHVCFDLISFCMFIFTWWYCTSSNTGPNVQEPIHDQRQHEVTKVDYGENEEVEDTEKEEIQSGDTISDWCDDSILSNVRFMKQKALVQEMKSKLTEDELEEERKTEKMQLQKIFQLLQEQEDKFQMSSMEQLEDQLHLYIN